MRNLRNEVRRIVREELTSRNVRLYESLTPKAQRFLKALQVVDNQIKDLRNITVNATPYGNWVVYHNGRMLTKVNGRLLDDQTIMQYGLEHYDDY